MEVHDGFIVGIYNYCDRWCETCAFTSRCYTFASRAEMEARLDPNLKAVAEAPPLPQDIPPPPPRWMEELLEELSRIASEPLSEEEEERLTPKVVPEHTIIEERAHAYSDRVHRWLEGCDGYATRRPEDPVSVIAWFQYSIGAKIHRALTGLAWDDADPDFPADHDGSAKMALLGMERSHAAWLQLAHTGGASASEIEPFIADLIWLADQIERVFPQARAFVRPGFDEPEEVAKLLAAERAAR